MRTRIFSIRTCSIIYSILVPHSRVHHTDDPSHIMVYIKVQDQVQRQDSGPVTMFPKLMLSVNLPWRDICQCGSLECNKNMDGNGPGHADLCPPADPLRHPVPPVTEFGREYDSFGPQRMQRQLYGQFTCQKRTPLYFVVDRDRQSGFSECFSSPL